MGKKSLEEYAREVMRLQLQVEKLRRELIPELDRRAYPWRYRKR